MFDNLIGQQVQHIKLGHGSFLTIGFGPDIHIEIVKRGKKEIKIRPAWYFWTYMCSWDLEISEMSVATSEDDRGEIEEALISLENKKLLKVEVLNDLYDMKLEFEEGVVLLLFSDNSEEDNVQWRLFTPDQHVLVAGPGNQLTYEGAATA